MGPEWGGKQDLILGDGSIETADDALGWACEVNQPGFDKQLRFGQFQEIRSVIIWQ